MRIDLIAWSLVLVALVGGDGRGSQPVDDKTPGLQGDKKEQGKQDEPKKDEPKKDEAKKDDKNPPKKTPGFIDVDDFIKRLPANLPKEQVDRLRDRLEEARKRFEEAQQRIDELKKRPLPDLRERRGLVGANRLGVRFEKPSETLVAQLGLPVGKGQVLLDVREGSAAAKAGLKSNDILLELAGKEVSSDQGEFVKALDEIKKDTPVEAVILRAGKRATIKGISLPETPTTRRPGALQRPNLKRQRVAQ